MGVADVRRELVSANEAAGLLGVTRQTLHRYRARPDFPASVKLGAARLFVRAELEEWARRRAVEGQGE